MIIAIIKPYHTRHSEALSKVWLMGCGLHHPLIISNCYVIRLLQSSGQGQPAEYGNRFVTFTVNIPVCLSIMNFPMAWDQLWLRVCSLIGVWLGPLSL